MPEPRPSGTFQTAIIYDLSVTATILRQSDTVAARKKLTVARVEHFQLVWRDPDGWESIAGTPFLSCGLSIFFPARCFRFVAGARKS